MRMCWTCNTEHDPDEACRQSPMARAERAAGGNPDSLFGRAPKPKTEATFETQCDACRDAIFVGDSITLDDGTWIHAECAE